MTAAANTIYARSFHHEDRARGEFDETVASLAKNPVVERRMTFEPNHKEIEVASREKKSAMASAGRPNTIWLAPPVHASALAIDWLLSRAVCIRRFHCSSAGRRRTLLSSAARLIHACSWSRARSVAVHCRLGTLRGRALLGRAGVPRRRGGGCLACF